MLEYARRLAKKMGVGIEPEVPGVFRVGDVRHTVSGIDKISRLGWSPTKGLDEIFDDYLAWLDTVPDAGDYFTPAYSTMKEAGVIRPVRPESAPAEGGLVKAACSPQSRS